MAISQELNWLKNKEYFGVLLDESTKNFDVMRQTVGFLEGHLSQHQAHWGEAYQEQRKTTT